MSRPSRLRIYVDKVIEAGWLAALILAPLFFNPYAGRVFDLSKVALVRTLALVMVAAWLIRCVESSASHVRAAQGGAHGRRLKLLARWRALCTRCPLHNPLALPTLLVVAACVVSTSASIAPTVSLYGSYARSQGLYVTLSYIVIACMAAGTMRTAAQLDRAVNVALVTSFPIAFYGIIQQYGLDPFHWPSTGLSRLERVASTLGNPIFVGGYLLMIIPLTLGRLLGQASRVATQFHSRAGRGLLYSALGVSCTLAATAWVLGAEYGPRRFTDTGVAQTLTPQTLGTAQVYFHLALGGSLSVAAGWWVVGWWKRRGNAFLLVGVYALLLAMQIVCVVFTQKRGPFLGLLGGLLAFAVLYALVRGARRSALAAIGVGVASLGLLVLVNLAASPFGLRHDTPYIGRLARVFDMEEDTIKVRALIWEGALRLGLPHAPLWSPTVGDDHLNRLRPLIGYGPELLYVAYHQVYSPTLAAVAGPMTLPDRAHNATLDTWVTTGLFGMAAYLALFSSLFLFGLQQLGLLSTARQRRAFMALWFGTAAIAALGAGGTLGWHFVGIALPGGMIVGFFLYLAACAVWCRQWPLPSSPPAVSLVMLIAALLGHFIEVQSGIAVTPTRTYFWFFVAALVGGGAKRLPAFGATGESRRRGSAQTSTAPLIAFALLAGLILAVLAFGFVSAYTLASGPGGEARAIDVVIASLTSKATTAGPRLSLAMLWLFLGTSLLALALGLAEWGRQGALSFEECLFGIGIFTAVAVTFFFACVVAQTLLLAAGNTAPLGGLPSTFSLFVLLLIGTVVLVGGTLLLEHPLRRIKLARLWSAAAVPAVGVIAAVLIVRTNVNVVQADIISRYASRFANAAAQIEHLRRSLVMHPMQEYLLVALAEAYLAYAGGLDEPARRDEVLAQAEEALFSARKINPFNPEHTVRLADLHYLWAGRVSSHSSKEGHFRKALDYYTQALRMSPNMVPIAERYARAVRDYSALLAQSHPSPVAPP
ncbi:MAG TPA: O-antigen ligase family protein [Alphaproteobacteria bacterium]|nr:O-antigen ligase family protein [Alphaproteobacteria bacterium]